jgi:signal transduction histidine kinase
LQTLTAARLKLHAVGTQAEHQGEGLLEIAELLKEEQNHIRGFVEENRSHQKFDQQTDKSDPIATLGSFVDSLKKLWNCTINLSVAVPTSEIPVAILEASKPILAEAVANAVVHGKSTQIAVEIAKVASALRITVTDNGLGLEDASGPYNHAQLATANIGPRSLRERVAALGGSLRLASSTKGVKLQITLPNSAGRP